MSAQSMRDVFDLLDEIGAKPIFSKKHRKFKLPTNRTIVFAKTPSSPRTPYNALALLRKELRGTEWEAIVNRSRHKILTNTIGEQLAAKGVDLDEVLPDTFDDELAIVADDFEEPVETPKAEYHPNLKVTKANPTPKPGVVRTLTPEQLQTANKLLLSSGKVAMDKYIEECRSKLVPVQSNAAQTSSVNPMDIVLFRAKRELEETTTHIAVYGSLLEYFGAQRDTEILKQAQLEQYIQRHEALAAEAQKLAEEANSILFTTVGSAPRQVQPQKYHSSSGSLTGKGRPSPLGYGIKDIENKVFPILRRRGIDRFSSRDVIIHLEEAGLRKDAVTSSQIGAWLYGFAKHKDSSIMRDVERGYFSFKQTWRNSCAVKNEGALAGEDKSSA